MKRMSPNKKQSVKSYKEYIGDWVALKSLSVATFSLTCTEINVQQWISILNVPKMDISGLFWINLCTIMMRCKGAKKNVFNKRDVLA